MTNHPLGMSGEEKIKHYDELLANAPAHDTPEFLEYLKANNTVVWETPNWLVIENCKYHKPDRQWLTAFLKGDRSEFSEPIFAHLLLNYGHLTWLKKSPKKQTVQRFHIHLYEE